MYAFFFLGRIARFPCPCIRSLPPQSHTTSWSFIITFCSSFANSSLIKTKRNQKKKKKNPIKMLFVLNMVQAATQIEPIFTPKIPIFELYRAIGELYFNQFSYTHTSSACKRGTKLSIRNFRLFVSCRLRFCPQPCSHIHIYAYTFQFRSNRQRMLRWKMSVYGECVRTVDYNVVAVVAVRSYHWYNVIVGYYRYIYAFNLSTVVRALRSRLFRPFDLSVSTFICGS